VRPYLFKGELPEEKQVLFGRVFIVAFLATVFVVSLFTTRTIFDLGVWSLSGYAGLFPIVVAALYWRRSTATGALAAVGTVVVLWVVLLARSRGVEGEYTIMDTGVMPVALIVLSSAASVVVGSLLGPKPEAAAVEKFFPTK